MLRIASLLLLAGVPSAAQLAEADVRAAFEEARTAVQQTTGKTLETWPPLTFTTAAELGRRVAEENLPLVRLRESDPGKAQQEANRIGQAFAGFAYAKYSWSAKEFLIVLDSWNLQARVFAQELWEDETVRAVLVHEIVHALDDADHDLTACALRCPTADAVAGFNALLEGHAQHVARAVCSAADWADGFEAFSANIGAPPKGLDEALLQFLRAQAAALVSAYRDGERFVAALETSGGEELVARAFQAPPDAETIFHPDWFLDPSSRPATHFDPEPVLDLFSARFPAEVWSATRATLTPAQVSAGLALLPAERAQALTATLRGARSLWLQPSADPSAKLVYAAVLEFDGPQSASAFLAAVRELSRLKDERMKSGAIRILSSSYESLDGEGSSGELFEKRMRNGPLEFDVLSIDLQRGPLLLETLFSNEPIEHDEHVALVMRLMDAVRAN